MAKEFCQLLADNIRGRYALKRGVAKLFAMAQVVLFGLAVSDSSVLARASGLATANICRYSAQNAAIATGVPLVVLTAISLTETGRNLDGKFSPWPWTVNMQGKGRWFAKKKEALAFAKNNFDRGARSFDIGCFQINYRWHGGNFASIEDMFDPEKNALYAARFLARLYKNKGNWAAAAGAYHSNTPAFAEKYAGRFSRILANLNSDNLPGSPNLPPRSGTAKIRQNRFPLLFSAPQTKGRTGSLVVLATRPNSLPLVAAATGRLF